ncbi:MAG: 3-hydroxyacyl-CoA dehydrogenase/enoyl-CoA hydratase family protein [Sneathiellaceae bacterium]
MARQIEKVAVIGAGVMGAAIAAHVANAGHSCLLLDIVPKDAEGANDPAARSRLAVEAVARMLKTKPAPFMHASFARRVQPGNLQDDLDKLADVDWICEAIIENPKIKQDLYARLDKVRKAGSIVSSNTSTIPLNRLVEGLPESFQRDFAITHFFNPPRYMRLLEVVGGAQTDPDALAALSDFGDRALGKEVVPAKDTPGFIANRIGIYWSYLAMQSAFDLGLSVEEADAICGKPMGIPKTGIFGLGDLTGLDLAPHVNESMLALLPDSDPFVKMYRADGPLVATVSKMIADGYTGRKGKGGFYRARGKEVRDLQTGDYRPKQKPDLDSIKAARKGLQALVEHDDRGGRYAWEVLAGTLSYAASLVPEIADDIVAVDRAMRTGYAWKWGPFELIDRLGSGWLAEKLAADGREVPAILQAAKGRPFYTEDGETAYALTPAGDYAPIPVADDAWLLADRKRGRQPVASNKGASIWDVGDGVACLELHTKMNAVDADIIAMVSQAAKLHGKGYKALIIGHDADNFSVGANVGLGLFQANLAMWPMLEQGISEGQRAYKALKYAPFPVVAAPAGMALGGGCEICLHADAIQAHAESYMGLVEVGVGLLPAWGGCKELLTRATLDRKRPGGPMPPIAEVFESIAQAKVATSAAEARDMHILRRSDGITMNRRRLLADAKAKALSLVEGYRPPEPVALNLPGPSARAALNLAVEGFVTQGKATAYDAVVAGEVARVLSGGDTDITEEVSEDQLMALEREGEMRLFRNEATLARIAHILETGKPLRN